MTIPLVQQVMPFVAVFLQSVVQLGHLLGGLDVDFDLILRDTLGLIASDIRKALDMLAQILQFEPPALFCGAPVQHKVFKVAHHLQIRDFLFRQILQIPLQLPIGQFKILPPGLELNGDTALPKVVDITVASIAEPNLILKVAHAFWVVHAEHLEQLRFEALCLSFLLLLGFLH